MVERLPYLLLIVFASLLLARLKIETDCDDLPFALPEHIRPPFLFGPGRIQTHKLPENAHCLLGGFGQFIINVN